MSDEKHRKSHVRQLQKLILFFSFIQKCSVARKTGTTAFGQKLNNKSLFCGVCYQKCFALHYLYRSKDYAKTYDSSQRLPGEEWQI